MTAILSNNPFLVTLRTIVAETPCKHWRSAETAARWGSTWEGLKRLTEPPGSLSAPISSANQWAGAGLWVRAEFSLLLTLILSLILDTNSLASLCHPRRVLARLVDTFRHCGLIHLTAAQLERISAATVCITQQCHSLHHSGSAQFASFRAATVRIIQSRHSLHHPARPRLASHSLPTVRIT